MRPSPTRPLNRAATHIRYVQNDENLLTRALHLQIGMHHEPLTIFSLPNSAKVRDHFQARPIAQITVEIPPEANAGKHCPVEREKSGDSNRIGHGFVLYVH